VAELVPIGTLAAELGLSPTYIRQLTELGVFQARRTAGGHRRYDLHAARAAWMAHSLAKIGAPPTSGLAGGAPTSEGTHALSGLEEHRVHHELAAPFDLGAFAAARQIVAYAFTEMLNNAIDHSNGTTAVVRIWRRPAVVRVEIADDGEGVFAHLRSGLGLPDLFASVQELSKGKRTTAPERHTGEGIFFTSKAVDAFVLEANGLAWSVDNLRGDQALGASPVRIGTVVAFTLDPETDRDLGTVFRRFSDEGHGFTRSRPVVRLFEVGVSFVSRSEAKRLLAGMERFAEVEVDFTGVEMVGQGFVDEMLRVWPVAHPDTRVVPVGMNEAVRFMVQRGLPGASGAQEIGTHLPDGSE
jgi:anti-sigma regulatory factor (Ser/Thr protein kinase)